MKKMLGLLLAFLLLACLTPSALADDTVYSEGYFYYTVDDGSITIVGYFGNETEVTVPAMIAGIPVNTIAPGAFDGTTVRKVNLPDTIMSFEAGNSPLDVTFDANTEDPFVVESGIEEENGSSVDEATVDLDLTEEQGAESTEITDPASGQSQTESGKTEVGEPGTEPENPDDSEKPNNVQTAKIAAISVGGAAVLIAVLAAFTAKKKKK